MTFGSYESCTSLATPGGVNSLPDLDLPPVAWLNDQLAKRQKPYRVESTDGWNVEIRELPGLAEDVEGVPNLSIRELFFGLDPDVLNDDEKTYERVGRDVQDKLSIGRLRVWGRRIGYSDAHPRKRSSLVLIDQAVWTHGRFLYSFFVPGSEMSSHYEAGYDYAPAPGTEWADLRFNLAEARRVWPHLVYPANLKDIDENAASIAGLV